MTNPVMAYHGKPAGFPGCKVLAQDVSFDEEGIRARLLDLSSPCFVVQDGPRAGIAGQDAVQGDGLDVCAYAPAQDARDLGDDSFKQDYKTRYAYYAGAMANAIASEDMVMALGREGFLGSFGAGGCVPGRVEEAIRKVQAALPNGPYMFNLIHSPMEPALEKGAAELYLKYGVAAVEASAYMNLTPFVVLYRAAGLRADPQGRVLISNRIIAKVSRPEVAQKFLEPAPERLLAQLVSQNQISAEQAAMARTVPMADDLTVEADSGGHTDNRPLVVILPSIMALADEIQARYRFERPARVGAAGGIGAPEAALAAFAMGAAYVVTGSVNQACVEAGASAHAKKLLAEAGMADVAMAPAADMFELGVKLQVLKRGTLFPMRAQKLYELYNAHASMEDIPAPERDKLEKQVFQKSLGAVWADTQTFFSQRDPAMLARAEGNPKKKMALVFRWYLGLSSRWSNTGEPGREMDYQIWCGPAMGAFNAWARGTALEAPAGRRVADVARHLLTGGAHLYRLQILRAQGVAFPRGVFDYRP